jgi:hypothetical protein
MSARRRVDNPDLIPYALYLLGGVGEFIDVEDVFVKCHELAPERFSWRSKPLPNYKSLSKALRDFEGKHPTLLLKTADGLRRQLSAEGVEWLKVNQTEIEVTIGAPGTNPPTRRPGQRLLNELADQEAVREFAAGGRPEFKKFQVADLLVCSPDSPPSVFRERLETYRSAAEEGGRPDLLAFLDFLKSEMSELFEG